MVEAIRQLYHGPVDIIDAVHEAGAIQAMVQMLSFDSQQQFRVKVFECIGDLAAEGRDDVKQSMVDAGVLPIVVAALASDSTAEDLDTEQISDLTPLYAQFLGHLCK